MCAGAARAVSKMIDIGKVRFNYSLTGKPGAAPIVFISGYTGNIDLWDTVASAFEPTHQVLRFDNQGIGSTADNGSALSIEAMAANTWGLVDALGLKDPAIAGFAMGSCIALEMARTRPEACAQLFLLSPVVKWSDEAQGHITELVALREASEAAAAGAAEAKAAASALYDLAFGSDFKKRVDFETFAASLTAPVQSLAEQKRQAAALVAFDASSWADSLRGKCTATVISPTEDLFASPSDAFELTTAIGATHVDIPCGHAAIAEAPGDIIRILRSALLGKTADAAQASGGAVACVLSTEDPLPIDKGAGHEL